MQAIPYSTLLAWASQRDHRGTVIMVGDALAKKDRCETLREKSLQAKLVNDFLAHHLDGLALLSAQPSDGGDVAELESKVLEAVNAQIETAAPVVREKRDVQWLQRLHAGVNAFLGFLDHEYVESNAAEETTDAGGRQGVSPGP
jgi:hypothetical protein